MSELYTAKVTAIGGRKGTIRSEDGLLHLKLALPRPMGGRGDATNPEQLFAGGYAACFENAVIHVTRNKEQKVADSDIEVVAVVGIGPNGSGGFKLSASLSVTIAGVDQKTAEEIVKAADLACPYSNAIRGNVDVAISVTTR
jgi:lipoyl-dependent peroxiredoxin